MRHVVIVDTCILTNLLGVPGKCQDRAEVDADLRAVVKAGDALLIPLAAIIETGNHIGQMADGGLRRARALQFAEFVGMALSETAPWTATPGVDGDDLAAWMGRWPELAQSSVGLGDVSILRVYEQQRRLHAKARRRVYIWSKDGDFKGLAEVEGRPVF